MTARVLSRDRGTVLTCSAACGATLFTGQVGAELIRAHAVTVGWMRGGAGDRASPSRKRWDICPTCAPAERERITAIAKRKAERLSARDQRRIERANQAAQPRPARKRRATQEASAEA